MAYPAPHFSTLSDKSTNFGKKNFLSIKWGFWFSVQLLSWIFFQSKKNWARYDQKCILGLVVKYRLFLSNLIKLKIFWQILKNTQISDFMKIRPVVAELFHAGGQTDRQTDRQTDTTKLTVALRNFSIAPKNSTWCSRVLRGVGSPNNQRLLPRRKLTDWFSFTAEVESVYCAVRTESWYKTDAFRL